MKKGSRDKYNELLTSYMKNVKLTAPKWDLHVVKQAKKKRGKLF